MMSAPAPNTTAPLPSNNMGSQGVNNDDPAHSIAAWVKQTFPDLKPEKIVDLGCTIGNNTLPYKEAFPDAEVHGIDVSAPCLRYAHARACALGVDVHFHQINAEETPFSDESFDLIVSRILLHETFAKALPQIMRECHRLLKPGGVMVHCDAPQFECLTPYQASLRDWDAYIFLGELTFAYAIYTAYFSLQGLSAATIGILLAVWSASTVVFELPSGALSDRFNRRTLLILSPLFKGACFIAWVLADGTVWLYGLGFMFWALSYALR